MVLTRSAVRRLATENIQRVRNQQVWKPVQDGMSCGWLDMTIFVLPVVLWSTSSVTAERLILAYVTLSVLLVLSYLAGAWFAEALAEDQEDRIAHREALEATR